MVNAVDKEQIQMLSDWWKTYGRSIVIAIILGLMIVFGWRYWIQYKENYRSQASNLYRSLFSAVLSKQAVVMNDQLNQLKAKYSRTPYASMGAMLVARSDVESHDLAKALTELNWVVENSKANSLRQLARLSAGQILLSQKHYPEAEKILQTVDDKTFQALINNLLGQVYLAEGDSVKAKQFFQSAKAGFQAAGINDMLIEMQLSAI